MKKILFIFIAIVLFQGCNRDNDDTTKSQFFNPPTWIQGKWGADNVSLFMFTNDDFLSTAGGNSFIGYKGLLQTSANIGGTAIVDESISETEYSFVIKMGNPGTSPISYTEYQFKKISSTKIEWVNSPYAGIFPYYLTKMN